MSLPLEGITVIELAQFIAGPSSTRILADWGAKVIKLESFTGDHNRVMGLLNNMPIEDDDNPSFDTTGLNKKFVGFNPRNKEAMEILHHMLETADVFMSNYRSQVLEKMGLDYETLHEKYPRLVYAQVTAYGNVGEEKNKPGYDSVCFGARGGMLGTTYQAGQEPINFIPAWGDLMTGMTLAGGICGALVKQQRTGTGDKVTVSLYHMGIFGNSWPIMGTEYSDSASYPRSRRQVSTPGINIYKTSDRWVMLACSDYNAYYDRLMECLGRADLVGDPRYCDLETLQREGRGEEFVAILDSEFIKHTAAHWMSVFEKKEVPLEPCSTFEEIANDRQAWDAGFIYKYRSHNGKEHIMVNSPVQFDSIGLIPRHEASRQIGYHTREILKDYSYSDEEIDRFIEIGAVKEYGNGISNT